MTDAELNNLLAAAENGAPHLQNTVGLMFSVQGDDLQAEIWYRKAAQGGDLSAQTNLKTIEARNALTPEACNTLGEYYEEPGPMQDFIKAARFYDMAAARGYAKAQCALGCMLLYGRGVARNRRLAELWFGKAAKQGNEIAQFNLACLLTQEQFTEIRKNYSEGARLYADLLLKNNAAAYHNLGELYEEGKGVEQSYAMAAELYKKSAEAGIPDSLFRLGCLFDDGLGVERNINKSLELWKRAADLGFQPAIETLKMRGRII
jgi:TPR repeat protein